MCVEFSTSDLQRLQRSSLLNILSAVTRQAPAASPNLCTTSCKLHHQLQATASSTPPTPHKPVQIAPPERQGGKRTLYRTVCKFPQHVPKPSRGAMGGRLPPFRGPWEASWGGPFRPLRGPWEELVVELSGGCAGVGGCSKPVEL